MRACSGIPVLREGMEMRQACLIRRQNNIL